MMKNVTFLFCSFMVFSALAQEAETKINWARTIDGYNTTDLTDLDLDNSGNTFVSVLYQGPLAEPGLKNELPEPGYVGGAVLKYNSEGKPLWMIGIKGYESAWPRSLKVLKNGDFVVTGSFDGKTTFNSVSGKTTVVGRAKTGNEYHQPTFIFCARYTNNGELKWVKAFQSIGAGMSVTELSNGDLWWSMHHVNSLLEEDNVIVEYQTQNSNIYQYSIVKLSAEGEIRGLHPFTYRSRNENPSSNSRLNVDKNDNLIVYGQFTKSIQFTPTDSLTNDGYYDSYDAFIVKFDKNDNYLWSKKIGGQFYQTISSLKIDDKERISMVGYYSYECIISNGIELIQKSQFEYKSGSSYFYCRFKEDGALDFTRFQRIEGYNSTVSGTAHAVDASGRTHVFGMFNDTLRVDGMQELVAVPGLNTGMYLRYKGDSLETLSMPIESKKSWIGYMDAVVKNGRLVVGGIYYGQSKIPKVDGKPFTFSERNYGRSTFIYSFNVSEVIEEETDQNEFAALAPFLACLSPKRIAEPNVWIPIEQRTNNQKPALVQSDDCGVVRDSCSAMLYPNPTVSTTTLTVKGLKGNASIQVFSASGQFLFAQNVAITLDEQSFELNFANVPPATYYVQLIQGNYKKVLPLVKSH